MPVVKSRLEPLDAMRFRILRETEQALLYGLEHPEAIIRIPVVEVGRGSFTAGASERFWAHVFGAQRTRGHE